MSTPRDTQFAGFAKLLLKEMRGDAGFLAINAWDTVENAKYEAIIAQRAYDLVGHVLDHTEPTIYGYGHVPDLAAWPDAPAPLAVPDKEAHPDE